MFKSPLTCRIIVLISISLLAASYLILNRSENILETALLDQTKQQAQVSLPGLESQLQSQNISVDPASYTVNMRLYREDPQ